MSSDAGVDCVHLRLIGDVPRFAAVVGTRRVTQGIYRFDEDVYRAVCETPLGREIPWDLLYRLPEWCVYIETPGMQ